jgi:hypothetical protein
MESRMDKINHMPVPVSKGGAEVRTPESELLERAEWYQAQYQKLLTALNEAKKQSDTFKSALEHIRDCDWAGPHPLGLSRADWMEQIAREALEQNTELNTELNTKESDV